MNCIITQPNHIYAIPSVLSRRDGCTILIKMSVLQQTQWLRRIWHLPTLHSERETAPNQLEILTDSAEIHWTNNFLSKLCFDHFIILFTQKTIYLTLLFFSMELDKIAVICHLTLPKKRKCKSDSQQNCGSWFLIAVSHSASGENPDTM